MVWFGLWNRAGILPGKWEKPKAAVGRFIGQEECVTELVTEQQAAGLLRVSVKCLQGWRSRGGGPPFVKLGRCVRYAVPALEAFVQDGVRCSTSDPGPALPGKPGSRIERFLEKSGRTLGRPGAGPSPPGKPR
jgi:hypothetical protein